MLFDNRSQSLIIDVLKQLIPRLVFCLEQTELSLQLRVARAPLIDAFCQLLDAQTEDIRDKYS